MLRTGTQRGTHTRRNHGRRTTDGQRVAHTLLGVIRPSWYCLHSSPKTQIRTAQGANFVVLPQLRFLTKLSI